MAGEADHIHVSGRETCMAGGDGPHTRFRKRNVYGRGRQTTYTFQEEKCVWRGDRPNTRFRKRNVYGRGRQTKYTFQEEKRVRPPYGHGDFIHVSRVETCIWPVHLECVEVRTVYLDWVDRLGRGTKSTQTKYTLLPSPQASYSTRVLSSWRGLPPTPGLIH